MSANKKPVALDETLQELVKAIRAGNAGQRELRDLISKQNEILGKNNSAAENVFVVPAVYDGAEYALDGITFDEALAAYENGKNLVLKIVHGDNVYLAPMVNYTYTENTSKIIRYFQFYSHSNPEGTASGTYILRRNTTISTGATSEMFLFSASYMDASKIVCDVTVDGTKYSTLDAALGALVAAVG